jgi:5-hydroxyisourate hydrolase
MSTISTHVLDTSLGRPAGGIKVTLERDGQIIGSGITDDDGRVKDLMREGAQLGFGIHKLVFEVGRYLTSSGREAFYERIAIEFVVSSDADHYHVPLLLSPFGYSTYRGS